MNKELFKIYADLRQVIGAVKESIENDAAVNRDPVTLFEESLSRIEAILYPDFDKEPSCD